MIKEHTRNWRENSSNELRYPRIIQPVPCQFDKKENCSMPGLILGSSFKKVPPTV
jgi:hypothetical protein